MITEIPNVNGTATVQWLGSWAGGGGSSYLVLYDASVCNMLASPSQPALDQALSDPANKRPLLFGMPQAVNSPVFGPAVCEVAFNSHTNFSQATLASDPNNNYYIPYVVTHIATTLYDDFTNDTGHFLEAVNFYYAGVPSPDIAHLSPPKDYLGNPSCVAYLPHMPNGSLPSGVSVTDSTGACVGGNEGYFMVDASNHLPAALNPNLYNGFVAWQLTVGDFNDPNVWHTRWEFDHDWFPNGFGTDGTQHLWGSSTTFPSSQQFSFDSCSLSYLNLQETLSCN
jgi:hypothetical protein